MDEKRRIKVSKYLSKHLRHSPQDIGLQLNKSGWVSVEELLQACQKYNFEISTDELIEVIETNEKKRFALSEDSKMIRASQGHSVEVDLGYIESQPPEFLYHGTTVSNHEAIMEVGLKKMNRHHVHLSPDLETATKVGQRHGKLLIYRVSTGNMYQNGFKFYCSANGVWLTDYVPPEYLEITT